jgi:cobyrinic acid a,c-diamide synthase
VTEENLGLGAGVAVASSVRTAMSPPALLVSAIASGQGKTTATAALARFFLGRGQRVRVFKAGADFLDALILERAAGHPVHVLDLWMVGETECRRLLGEAAVSADVVLVEGVMGLYDGAPSSADLARVFDLGVLAVIDVAAMAQTVGAVALGLRDFGKVRLVGVIANGVAGRGHAAMVSAALEDIPLLASMPRQTTAIPERHLGLHLPDEAGDLEAHLAALALASAERAVAHPRGGAGEIIYRVGALTASYFHAYFNSCPLAIADLLTGADP